MATRKTAARRKSTPKHAYRLLVKLDGSEPPIWRLISVPGHMTLADLDRIIQAAMGWTNSHMHCRRRSKSEPPCRSNIEPGAQASFSIAGCG